MWKQRAGLERRVPCDEGEVDLEEERCVGIAETSLREGIYAEETSRVLWSRVDVDEGGDGPSGGRRGKGDGAKGGALSVTR